MAEIVTAEPRSRQKFHRIGGIRLNLPGSGRFGGGLSGNGFRRSGGGKLRHQLGHAVRHLRAHAHPILDALVDQIRCERDPSQ